MRSARFGLVAALPVLVLAAGCERQSEPELSSACSDMTASSVEQALESAPGQVAIEGETLSSCLEDNADAQDVQRVGAIYVATAAKLADEARSDRNGPAATQLGYLIGAVRRGASGTQGVHDELRRRVEQELQELDSPAIERGERAGRTGG